MRFIAHRVFRDGETFDNVDAGRLAGYHGVELDVRDDGEGRTYAVGYNGIVVQYDGSEWSILTSGFHDRLNAVDIDPCGNIIMAGHWGIILRNGY